MRHMIYKIDKMCILSFKINKCRKKNVFALHKRLNKMNSYDCFESLKKFFQCEKKWRMWATEKFQRRQSELRNTALRPTNVSEKSLENASKFFHVYAYTFGTFKRKNSWRKYFLSNYSKKRMNKRGNNC